MGDKGNSDYVFVNENMLDRIKEFKIFDRVDSDHIPLYIRIRKEEGRRKEEDKEEEHKRGW